MAIFGNFKGTTKSEFQIGKNGNRISTGSEPTADISNGDLFIDNANAELKIYSNAWVEVGSTLSELNVDDGTLTVNATNDTVSIGSTASNEKLFVNGNMRLGTNPSLQYSGAYLDVRHSNGSQSQVRIRDNSSGQDPIFKVFNASNSGEVFKVQGSTIRVNDTYDLPTSDGTSGQAIVTDGSGSLSFTTIESGDAVTDFGLITESSNVTVKDYGAIGDEAREPTSHDSYTVSEANNIAIKSTGDMIFVSDEVGGAVMAFYDGTNWRRITDRAVIST